MEQPRAVASAVASELDHRYLLERGRVYLSGVQALVRLPLAQARRDAAAGLRTGAFISGYPGSPLGGYDLALASARKHLEPFGIVHRPAQNEEMAATALQGTQMLELYPHSRFDGVTGIWYGKGPGMDRSGDAMRHGNYMGTSTKGAVVVLSAEDHEAKSSSHPFQQEYAFAHCGIPVLYPSSVPEFLEYGLHAIAMSRYSGCWVGMKLVGQLCDGSQSFEVDPARPETILPDFEVDGRPFKKSQYFVRLVSVETIENERLLFTHRQPAAVAYVAANGLDRVPVRSRDDRLAIVSAGKSWSDLRQALADMRLSDLDLSRAGVRLVKIACVYPADERFLRDALAGIEEVVVIEEKRSFLEDAVKAAIVNRPNPPRVHGKRDPEGAEWFPNWGALDADAITSRLGPRLADLLPEPGGVQRRREEILSVKERPYEVMPKRTPNYCSGCPHNVSTRLLPGQVAWSAPGCHIFATIIEQPERHVDFVTQYGGEGLPWIGLSPFTDRPHMIQNQGDGGLFHSSYQNIRFAIASDVNLTFKILYNGAIANTGAQVPVGIKDVPRLAKLLSLEGVARIGIVAKDPGVYAGVDWPANCKLHGVEAYDKVMRALEQTPGVTVFLYDGECANERRRKQKRGLVPRSTRYVLVNEDVCENCGNCGDVANCMSLQKVETEFGAKTQIHQSSCNQDQFCLSGDCPSFVTVDVKPGTGLRRPLPPELGADDVPGVSLPRLDRPYRIYIPGVGGTGVLTINAILGWAALLDGRQVSAYDQTGAAQKWGAVVSSIVISEGEPVAANRVGYAEADLYLAFDLMAGSDRVNLDRCHPRRTVAVMNTTLLPNGEMIRDVSAEAPIEPMMAAIDRWTDPERNLRIEARRLAESLFGDYMASNIFALGAAYQAGLLPIRAQAIESAIQLNGVSVKQNLQAFRYGRLARHDPERLAALTSAPASTYEGERERRASALGRSRASYEELLDRAGELDEETRRLLAVRIAELIDYQSAAYATAYVDFVLVCAAAERERLGEECGYLVTREVARQLHKLMAYKDEYEVARLHLRAGIRARAEAAFEAPVSVGYMLHPPFLRALGMKRKLRFGQWFNPALALLRSLKPLRGTPFDVFGTPRVRRVERELPGWYRIVVSRALQLLTPAKAEIAVQLARTPDLIRGYEEIKLGNVELAKRQADLLLSRLEAGGRLLPVVGGRPV